MANHNFYNHHDARGALLEEAETLLNRWTANPFDVITVEDHALGIIAERAHNKYHPEWFHGIGELVSAIDEYGLGTVAERSNIHNIVTALSHSIQTSQEGIVSSHIMVGDHLLRGIIDMLQQ